MEPEGTVVSEEPASSPARRLIERGYPNRYAFGSLMPHLSIREHS